MSNRPVSAWPLVAGAVALGLASWALALKAVVTFPLSLASGALVVLGLGSTKGRVFPRHYALGLVLSLAAVLATHAWQRAGP